MFMTEKEIRRIVSIHFKEKYKMEVNPTKMKWVKIHSVAPKATAVGLSIGGTIIEKDS